MNTWILPMALLTFTLPEAPRPIAGIKVGYRHPNQKRLLIRNIERDVLEQARDMGVAADLDHPAIFLLRIVMPCGCSAVFKRASDIPLENVPCPCENGRHFLVYYDLLGLEHAPSEYVET